MRTDRRTDAELIEAASRDAEAFGVLYDRHIRKLLGFFRARGVPADAQLDLAAETFATALATIERFDPARGEPLGWLFGIARNKLSEAFRAGAVQDGARRALGMQPVTLLDGDQAFLEQLAAEAALELLAGLPAVEREAIVARHIDERGYDEIAAQLRCSESVVRKRVSRGLGRLRAELARGAR